MISLNDYLYNGDTVLKILHNYEADLRKDQTDRYKQIETMHADYLREIIGILEHNDFLTSQSQRIREFYKYMAQNYPQFAFTFKGRIKSLIRAEEKFNRNIIDITEQLWQEGEDVFSPELEHRLASQMGNIRDLIAYRIVVSMPKCHIPDGKDARELEWKVIYEIAEKLPFFLEEYQFIPEQSGFSETHPSSRLKESVQKYYKDFIEYPTESGYQSLHIVFYDKLAKCRFEIQIRSKDMDDYAEIGYANHSRYEQAQKKEGTTQMISAGVLPFYDDAYARLELLQDLDLSKVDVNMFAAKNNLLMNDGCGFYRGRLILPYEHLSRFQNDLIG